MTKIVNQGSDRGSGGPRKRHGVSWNRDELRAVAVLRDKREWSWQRIAEKQSRTVRAVQIAYARHLGAALRYVPDPEVGDLDTYLDGPVVRLEGVRCGACKGRHNSASDVRWCYDVRR